MELNTRISQVANVFGALIRPIFSGAYESMASLTKSRCVRVCVCMHVCELGMQQYRSTPYCVLLYNILQYITVLQYLTRCYVTISL